MVSTPSTRRWINYRLRTSLKSLAKSLRGADSISSAWTRLNTQRKSSKIKRSEIHSPNSFGWKTIRKNNLLVYRVPYSTTLLTWRDETLSSSDGLWTQKCRKMTRESRVMRGVLMNFKSVNSRSSQIKNFQIGSTAELHKVCAVSDMYKRA